MCRVLEIARSSYYKWLNRETTQEEIENNELSNLILDYDELFGHILGYRRMTEWINTLNNFNYNYKRVYRIMKLLGIKSKIRVSRRVYPKVTPEISADNLLARDFSASAPNEKWLTDVSEFKIKGTSKKLYLCAIIDLYDMSIVSYTVGPSNNNVLVFKTIEEAFRKNPEATPLVHSDRGYQFTSPSFKSILDNHNSVQSMSRVGHCIDNGPIEGFWGIIKSEMYYINTFNSYKDLKEAIDKYIYFYNNIRLQKRFNNQTPIMIRQRATKTNSPKLYPIAENKKIKAFWNNIESKQTAQLQA